MGSTTFRVHGNDDSYQPDCNYDPVQCSVLDELGKGSAKVHLLLMSQVPWLNLADGPSEAKGMKV